MEPERSLPHSQQPVHYAVANVNYRSHTTNVAGR